MDKSAEKLKALIKGKVGEKPSYGTDPNEPWSVKAGITEDTISEDELLNRYMKTRGINPKTASKISKISASKTGDFEKWKRDHVSGGRLPMPKTEEAGHLGDFPKLKGSENRKRELSKSARMIKALYKKHRMVKEEIYDHEKEDKSVATYGKKPKFDKTDKDDTVGEKKPEAAAVMSGGTTLTKQKRDTIEIDPLMRVRPGQPDPFKKDDKDKDKKKEEKK